jgi:hypothetical protein
VRAELRAVAALNNVELITALLSSNSRLAIVGLQLRIINGVVSLITTEVGNKALARYLSEQTRASGNSGLSTAFLEAPDHHLTAKPWGRLEESNLGAVVELLAKQPRGEQSARASSDNRDAFHD